jgi:hypothetical protein
MSNADANQKHSKKPMKIRLDLGDDAESVKISRGMRELHASAEKLFAKNFSARSATAGRHGTRMHMDRGQCRHAAAFPAVGHDAALHPVIPGSFPAATELLKPV